MCLFHLKSAKRPSLEKVRDAGWVEIRGYKSERTYGGKVRRRQTGRRLRMKRQRCWWWWQWAKFHRSHWWHTLQTALSSPALARTSDCLKPLQIFTAQERCHCLFCMPTSNARTHRRTSDGANCQSLTTNIDGEKRRPFNIFSVVWLKGNWQVLSKPLHLVSSYTHRNTYTTGIHHTTFPKPR